MKILKEFLGIFLSVIIVAGNMSFINIVKAAENYGYIHVRYVDMNKDIGNPDEDIHSRLTQPVLLDSTGKGSYLITVPGIEGYEYQYAMQDGTKVTQKSIPVTVTSSNTDDNAVEIIVYYSSTYSTFSVTTYGGTIHSDGSREVFYENSQSVKSGTTITTNAPGPAYPSQKFLGYTFNEDEGILGTNSSVSITVTDESEKIYYWYGEPQDVTGDVTVTTGDHILNVDDMKVVNEPDGKDYFGRKDTVWTVNGSRTITVKSPTNGVSKPGYKLYFALMGVPEGRGEPNEALNKYVTPPGRVTSTSFNIIISPAVTNHYYVHFYWVPEDTPPPGPGEPTGDQIVFNPNETSWTFDSSKKPGWSNSGKTSNGSGDYKVNAKYVGANPTMAKGTVTYTYEVKHTGTTGNPPHEYTYYTTEHYSEDFDVSYYIKNMSISGDDSPNPTSFNFNDVGQGTSFPIVNVTGDVHIKKEGVNLKLSGAATWYDLESGRDYKVPAFHGGGTLTGTDIQLPSAPANPKGNSGSYKLDWTNPEIGFSVQPGIFSTDRNAVRKASQKGEGDGFYGTLTFSDNLSGCKSLEYGWTFGNHPGNSNYEQIYSSNYTDGDRNSETLTREIEKPVGDDLYLHTKLVDMAGNETDKTFGPFEDPIKLKNFRVTDVTDPTWSKIFWNDAKDYVNKMQSTFTQSTGKEFKVNELPLDSDSNPYGTYIKKGYAFYFTVDSEYLYRDYDRIEITPTFYYWDGTKRVQVDAYYNKDNNPFTKVGSEQDNWTLKYNTKRFGGNDEKFEIGGYSKLTLTKDLRTLKGRTFYNGWKDEIQYKDGKEQYWYGKYYLPDTTIFTKKGKTPRPENVLKKNYIIINFQIKAYKNGPETNSNSQIFTYVPGQWTAENGPKAVKYKVGDVIVYDNKYRVFSNFRSVITN